MAKKVYRAVKAATGSPADFLMAVEDKIAELGGETIEMSENVEASDVIDNGDILEDENVECAAPFKPYKQPAAYKIHDTYGAPQAGCETTEFDEWYEVEEYLDEHPEVRDRIAEGYASIEGCDELITL